MSFDLPTFVLQAVNFLVLALVLWRLLWRPLRKHMRERAERIAQGLDTLEQERAYLGQLERQTEAALEEARGSEHEALQAAELEAQARRTELLEAAREAALVERARILAQATVERERRDEEARRALEPAMASLLARLLTELGDAARLHEVTTERFAEHLLAIDGEERERARKLALDGRVELVLARQGSAPALDHALQSFLPEGTRCETQVDEALIGGALLRVGEIVLDGSVRAQLGRALGRP